MAEETIYSDNRVNITTTRVILNNTTYALRNITSVKMATTPAKKGCAIALLIFGILAFLGSFGSMTSDVTSGVVALIFGGVIIAGAIFWMRSCRADYHVAIASSSGEANALTDKDRSYIEKVVACINDAITRY